MAGTLEQYNCVIHNTLAKTISIDLVDRINRLAKTGGSSAEEKRLVRQLEKKGIDGYVLRGSDFHNVIDTPLPYPRNTDDMDIAPVGNGAFHLKQGSLATRALFAHLAESMGARFETLDPKTVEAYTWERRNAYREHKKDEYTLVKSFSAQELQRILSEPEHYRLKGQDETILRGLVDKGEPVEVRFAVSYEGMTQKPDLPPMDRNGKPVRLHSGKFGGMYLWNFLEKCMGNLNALNQPMRNAPLDILDLYNMMIVHGRPDGRLTSSDIDAIEEQLQHGASAYEVNNRSRGREWLMSRGPHRQYVSCAVLGRPNHGIAPPDDAAVRQLKTAYDELARKNVLPRSLTEDEIRTCLDVVYENSRALLRVRWRPGEEYAASR